MSSCLPVSIEGLCLERAGRVALQSVDLTLSAGTRTLVLGPNGAGKSVLLRILHGLIEPSAGRIRWQGGAGATRPTQAMVFQRPVLLRRSVRANVEYPLRLAGVARAERRRRCDEILERAGLARLASRPARALSGGEQQRVVIARAWVTVPAVLLLDEPTANLDPAAVAAVEELVRGVHASGTKVVMTTHDLAQARRLADDVVFLARGRCLEHTPAAEFFDTPRSAEAREFLAGKLLA